MSRRLGGILGPAVSTFDAGGELAPSAFRANIRAHLRQGLAGVVVGGSTGEGALLDESERLSLVEWARRHVPEDRWLIVGTGAESTRLCIRRTHGAAARGADAALVIAPHYYGRAMTRPALSGHFHRVADASPVPLILYNHPGVVHFSLEPELVAELAGHERIIGVKDSSGDLALLEQYLAIQSEEFAVLTGNASLLAEAVRRGASGGILAVSLFAPRLALDVVAMAGAGDLDASGASQARLTPLATVIVGQLGVAGVKAALDRVGLAGGPVRPPLQPLGTAEAERVDALLRAAELAHAA